MRAKAELVKNWTSALVSVCNHNQSHAAQEVKWLLQHAKEQTARLGMKSSAVKTDYMSEAEIGLMQNYIHQRVHDRKPLQYILGRYSENRAVSTQLAKRAGTVDSQTSFQGHSRF